MSYLKRNQVPKSIEEGMWDFTYKLTKIQYSGGSLAFYFTCAGSKHVFFIKLESKSKPLGINYLHELLEFGLRKIKRRHVVTHFDSYTLVVLDEL